MAKGPKKAPTFRMTVTAGTPNHREKAVKVRPSDAKNWLLDRLERRKEWADTYARDTADKLAEIRVEINEIDPHGLHVGETRTWSAIDDYSKVEFVFEMRLDAR